MGAILVFLAVLTLPISNSSIGTKEERNDTSFFLALSILSGTTVLNSVTVIGGGATPGLDKPSGIAVIGTDADSIIVSDARNHRVIALWNIDTVRQNISVVATEWAPGQTLNVPRDMYLDVTNTTDLYLSEGSRHLVLLYSNIRGGNSRPRIVAGTNDTGATGLRRLDDPCGVILDSSRNLIVVSSNDHRIIYWPRNAVRGIVIAGLGVASSASTGLNAPNGIALDEQNGLLYVADTGNNRIQRYFLNHTWPCNGTTVAGGNGIGNRSHQLYNPVDIRLSTKTGAMYIVDRDNNRIQRWQQGDTQGVTIAGSPNGILGTGATRLNNPTVMAFNVNETHMYVVDRDNNRVQRFRLI